MNTITIGDKYTRKLIDKHYCDEFISNLLSSKIIRNYMMKNKIRNIINEIFPISDESFVEIEKLLEFEMYSKGETFISKNKRNEKEYFVLSGICKSYLINPDGQDISD